MWFFLRWACYGVEFKCFFKRPLHFSIEDTLPLSVEAPSCWEFSAVRCDKPCSQDVRRMTEGGDGGEEAEPAAGVM